MRGILLKTLPSLVFPLQNPLVPSDGVSPNFSQWCGRPWGPGPSALPRAPEHPLTHLAHSTALPPCPAPQAHPPASSALPPAQGPPVPSLSDAISRDLQCPVAPTRPRGQGLGLLQPPVPAVPGGGCTCDQGGSRDCRIQRISCEASEHLCHDSHCSLETGGTRLRLGERSGPRHSQNQRSPLPNRKR